MLASAGPVGFLAAHTGITTGMADGAAATTKPSSFMNGTTSGGPSLSGLPGMSFPGHLGGLMTNQNSFRNSTGFLNIPANTGNVNSHITGPLGGFSSVGTVPSPHIGVSSLSDIPGHSGDFSGVSNGEPSRFSMAAGTSLTGIPSMATPDPGATGHPASVSASL